MKLNLKIIDFFLAFSKFKIFFNQIKIIKIFEYIHFFIILITSIYTNSSSAQLPYGFIDISVDNFDSPMGVLFNEENEMFVFERGGKVFKYENNIKYEILNISEEVATYGDYGVMSMALDPNFSTNGYFYLYYVVDRHHLINFGTENYSPFFSEQGATISRLTRYTADKLTDYKTVIPNSRFVLVGETKSSGFPLTGIWHPGGDIKFANDGSLLVSCGDAAAGVDYEQQAYEDQIITQTEYDAPRNWRCQMPNSLSGKIIRIDPATGNGIPSNPFYNSSLPKSPQSRVWAMGLRNPFRFSIKPNTGGHLMSEGNPGILLIGDVGQDTNEELNISDAGGQNFGWPNLEGIDLIHASSPTLNPSNPKAPVVQWGRGGNAKVQINGSFYNVPSTQYPFPNFGGGCSIGGDWYTGTSFPPQYQNSYFFADFNDQWVKSLSFDSNNNPASQLDFSPSIYGAIYFKFNATEDAMYYCSVNGKVGKIIYSPSGNQLPKAILR